MGKCFGAFIIILVLLFIGTKNVWAATYYVSTTGNDSDPGTVGQPWATISLSLYKLTTGDTLVVTAGTYSQSIAIPQSGMVVEASGNVYTKNINVTGNSNVVRGFKISDASSDSGIRVSGDNNLFENNEIYHTKQDGIWYFGSGNIFRGNYLHDLLDPSIPGDPHADCFQTWSYNWNTTNVLFEKNICDHTRNTGSNQISMMSRSSSLALNNITFRNNIFIMHDAGYSPLNFDTLDPLYPLSDIYIYNNTFYNTTGAGSAAIVMDGIENAVIKNNVTIGYTDFILFVSGGATMASNVSTGPYGMVDYLNSNFHLLRGSTLVDTGVGVGVSGDYDNVSRPQGSAVDVGAFEYIPLTVTINQAIGQSDSTPDSPINFTVVFSESVSDFATGDVTLSGSAGATTAVVTGSGTTYNVAVSGMTGAGTVVATILTDKATGATANTNEESTSSDNSVTYSPPIPPVLTSISIGDSGGFTNLSMPIINVVASNSPTQIAFSCDGGINWSGWIAYSATISTFDITNGATNCSIVNESKTITAKLKNADGESSTSSDSTFYDTSAPTGGSIVLVGGDYVVAAVGLTVADGTDGSGAGINTSSRIVERKTAVLTGGTCGVYDSFGVISTGGTYPNFVDSTVVSGNCYLYRYLVSDNLGHQVIYTSASEAKVLVPIPNVTLSYVAGSGGTLTGSTIQTVQLGSSGTSVSAVGDSGYLFWKWSDELRDNPRQDIGVSGDINVEALFENSRTLANPSIADWQSEVGSGFISTGSTDATNTDSFMFNLDYYLVAGDKLVFFPRETVVTKTEGGSFDMTVFESTDNLTEIQSQLAHVLASIKIGVTGVNLSFSGLITVSVPVGNSYNGQTLTVNSKNEGSSTWNGGISCVVSGGSCSFQTNHATSFAVMENYTEPIVLRSNSNNSGAPSCNDAKPASITDLFQINVNNKSAKLFFTPISNTNRYFISFSTKANAEEHGAEVTLAREGVQNFTVNLLKPNTTYYFKIRGQKGCMPGEWSGIMKAKTSLKNVTKFTPYYKYNLIKSLFKKILKR